MGHSQEVTPSRRCVFAQATYLGQVDKVLRCSGVHVRKRLIAGWCVLSASTSSAAAIMSTDTIHTYQTELLIQAEEVGALKFGQFTLKSGR